MSKKSIARLLVELKTLVKQIETAKVNSVFVGNARRNDGMPQVMGRTETVNELEEIIRERYQQITDLIARHTRIKSAITLSNATTSVTICGKSMSVADAIHLKLQIESIEKPLLEIMRRQFAAAVATHDKLEGNLTAAIDKLIEDSSGKDRKADQDGLRNAISMKQKMGSPILVDPLKLREQIEAKQKYIEEYLAEVDLALSESNAKTELDV